jgi:hypothetical protein
MHMPFNFRSARNSIGQPPTEHSFIHRPHCRDYLFAVGVSTAAEARSDKLIERRLPQLDCTTILGIQAA